jgi:hypothetical protein
LVQYERTSLFMVAEKGDATMLKQLLSAQASTGCRRGNGQTPLHAAAYSNQLECTTLLLDAKADIDALGDNGQGALHFASCMNCGEMTELLCKRKAKTNFKDRHRNTVISPSPTATSPPRRCSRRAPTKTQRTRRARRRSMSPPVPMKSPRCSRLRCVDAMTCNLVEMMRCVVVTRHHQHSARVFPRILPLSGAP